VRETRREKRGERNEERETRREKRGGRETRREKRGERGERIAKRKESYLVHRLLVEFTSIHDSQEVLFVKPIHVLKKIVIHFFYFSFFVFSNIFCFYFFMDVFVCFFKFFFTRRSMFCMCIYILFLTWNQVRPLDFLEHFQLKSFLQVD
jgi:hypothetical protein